MWWRAAFALSLVCNFAAVLWIPALVNPVTDVLWASISNSTLSSLALPARRVVDNRPVYTITWCPKDWVATFDELCRHFPDTVRVICKANWTEANYVMFSDYRQWAPKPELPPSNQVYWMMENSIIMPPDPVMMLTNYRHSVGGSMHRNIRHTPHALIIFASRPNFPITDLLQPRPRLDPERVWKRRRFCAFVAHECAYNQAYVNLLSGSTVKLRAGDLMPRTVFFDKLSKYKRVDALSTCRHNRAPPLLRVRYPGYSEEPILWYEYYKFVMVMENSMGPGYLSEKLFNGYLSHAIPIYWGASDLPDFINTDAIVWCRPDDTDFSRCMAEVLELDKNKTAYMAKLHVPIFKGNVIPDWMRWEKLASDLIEWWDWVNYTRTHSGAPGLLS